MNLKVLGGVFELLNNPGLFPYYVPELAVTGTFI